MNSIENDEENKIELNIIGKDPKCKSILRLKIGDITEEKTDAIVNAANEYLQLGAGVAGAIRRKGGPEIQAACDDIGFTQTGTAAITTGGKLPSKYVIHAVGPVWGSCEEDDADYLLASATKSSLELALATGLKSVSFPAISTGIYGFPKERAAKIMLTTIISFLKELQEPMLVQMVLFTESDYKIFIETAKQLKI